MWSLQELRGKKWVEVRRVYSPFVAALWVDEEWVKPGTRRCVKV